MGCGGSTEDKGRRKSRNSVSRGSLGGFFRQQKISIRIGNDVKVLDEFPKIVFMFGGPGSKKGLILDHIVHMFDFKFINIESVIMEELSKKIAEPGSLDKAAEIQELIKEQPNLLTLNWVLQELTKRIDKDRNSTYVVDIVPNLKFLLRVESFIKDCSSELRQFESKYPVSFALNLATKEKTIKKKEVECAVPPVKDGQPAPSGVQSSIKQGGKSDEADSGRTFRRAHLYQNSAKLFIEYFQKADRMVNVDVSSGDFDNVWIRVCEFFYDLEFAPMKSVNTVIVFIFDEIMLDEIAINRYGMDMIQVREAVDDPQAPVEKLIQWIRNRINNSDPTLYDGFLVDLSGTSISPNSVNQFKERSILFMDFELATLDKFLPARMRNLDPCKIVFKSVISSDNEVCLFPPEVDSDLCKVISLCLA